MKYKIKPFLITLIALGTLASQPPLEAGGGGDSLSLQFSVYAQARINGVAFINSGGEPEELTFYSSSLSDPYQYEGDGTLLFYDAVELRESEPDNQPLPLARLRVTGEVQDAVLVFFPNPAHTAFGGNASEVDKFRVFAFSNCFSDRPAGTITLFNASGREVAGRIGERRISVGAGIGEPIYVGSATRVQLAARTDQRVALFYDQPMRLDRNERMLFVIFPPFVENTTALQHRLIRDRVNADEGSQAARASL